MQTQLPRGALPLPILASSIGTRLRSSPRAHLSPVRCCALVSHSFVNFLSQTAKDYALEQMKSVTVRNIPIRCFVSDSKCTLLIVGLPPSWTPAQLKTELERIGGPMIGEPSLVKPGQVHANYINYRRAEKALALLSGKPCGTTPGGPIMNASLAQGKPPPKIPGAAPPATLFIKNIAGSIDEAGLAKCQCTWMQMRLFGRPRCCCCHLSAVKGTAGFASALRPFQSR